MKWKNYEKMLDIEHLDYYQYCHDETLK